ncbi:unnamed protein product [Orchesella dallaii]|uniref:CRAL-TRIO domain-containing protein n=1 Tax=Orchesella dallaii TaxID=48710 RepID=A0ABP1RR87_9HEXA
MAKFLRNNQEMMPTDGQCFYCAVVNMKYHHNLYLFYLCYFIIDKNTLIFVERWNASGVSVTDIICVTILLLEEISRRQSSGVSIVIDWDGFGFAQYRQITYRTLVRGFAVLQGTLPISFKGIHQLNPSIMFSMVSKIFFSLLSAKLKKRIHIHGTDLESFAAHIPKSSLPVEYGGTSEEDEDREFMDTLYKNEDYYCKLTEHFRQT